MQAETPNYLIKITEHQINLHHKTSNLTFYGTDELYSLSEAGKLADLLNQGYTSLADTFIQGAFGPHLNKQHPWF